MGTATSWKLTSVQNTYDFGTQRPSQCTGNSTGDVIVRKAQFFFHLRALDSLAHFCSRNLRRFAAAFASNNNQQQPTTKDGRKSKHKNGREKAKNPKCKKNASKQKGLYTKKRQHKDSAKTAKTKFELVDGRAGPKQTQKRNRKSKKAETQKNCDKTTGFCIQKKRQHKNGKEQNSNSSTAGQAQSKHKNRTEKAKNPKCKKNASKQKDLHTIWWQPAAKARTERKITRKNPKSAQERAQKHTHKNHRKEEKPQNTKKSGQNTGI